LGFCASRIADGGDKPGLILWTRGTNGVDERVEEVGPSLETFYLTLESLVAIVLTVGVANCFTGLSYSAFSA
jgi:hypothetical protein